jgi:hypothetical protein
MAIRTRVVNMIPQSQSNETNDDSETWTEAGIVPASTLDYNAKFSRNALYCGDLTSFVSPGGPLAVFTTTDPFSGLPMVQIDTEPNIDQPWMAVETVSRGPDTGKDRVYAGYTNWNFVTSVATIDVSQDGAAAVPVFNSVTLQNRAVTRNAPSVRPATHLGFDHRGRCRGARRQLGIGRLPRPRRPPRRAFRSTGRHRVQRQFQWGAWPGPVRLRPRPRRRSAAKA